MHALFKRIHTLARYCRSQCVANCCRYGPVLQELLPQWPALVSCLFAPGSQLAAAALKVLGQAGAIIWLDGLSKLAAATATAAVPPASAAPPPTAAAGGAGFGLAGAAAALPLCPPELLFDWLLPLLTGQAPVPGHGRASPSAQVGTCRWQLKAKYGKRLLLFLYNLQSGMHLAVKLAV